MDGQQQWQPVLPEEDGKFTRHREPGEEFLFYRSVAAARKIDQGIGKAESSTETETAASSQRK